MAMLFCTSSVFSQEAKTIEEQSIFRKALRLPKWKSIDPKAAQFPSMSPYNLYGGNPVLNVDSRGDRPIVANISEEAGLPGDISLMYDSDATSMTLFDWKGEMVTTHSEEWNNLNDVLVKSTSNISLQQLLDNMIVDFIGAEPDPRATGPHSPILFSPYATKSSISPGISPAVGEFLVEYNIPFAVVTQLVNPETGNEADAMRLKNGGILLSMNTIIDKLDREYPDIDYIYELVMEEVLHELGYGEFSAKAARVSAGYGSFEESVKGYFFDVSGDPLDPTGFYPSYFKRGMPEQFNKFFNSDGTFDLKQKDAFMKEFKKHGEKVNNKQINPT
jgi:hypothetical protein